MIPTHVFVGAAKDLLVGKQTRLNHEDCPAGRDTRGRLYVKRKDIYTVLAYCHNCGQYGVHSLKGKTKAIRDLLVENEVVQRDGAGELVLPDDVVFNSDRWPDEARHWVHTKYGITWHEVQRYGICYSASWHRVILPVYENGKLVFWQGRALEPGQDPKYISAKAHPKAMFWAHCEQDYDAPLAKKVFIVEDMLSAIKMARYVDSVALLGTSPDFSSLSERLSEYQKVGVFLDPDLAGITKANELKQRLSLAFMGQVRKFIESRQPKEMTNAELERIAIDL